LGSSAESSRRSVPTAVCAAPSARTVTIPRLHALRCAYGTQTIARELSRRPDRRTSGTTPTISRYTFSSRVDIARRPIGFSLPNIAFAKDSFTIITGVEAVSSRGVKSRPRTGIPSAPK
jgi:hypothetical protein